jgi:hypothetical protein
VLPKQLTPEALALLVHLRTGNNIADPMPNIGAFAYSSHARTFFSNAAALNKPMNLTGFAGSLSANRWTAQKPQGCT